MSAYVTNKDQILYLLNNFGVNPDKLENYKVDHLDSDVSFVYINPVDKSRNVIVSGYENVNLLNSLIHVYQDYDNALNDCIKRRLKK